MPERTTNPQQPQQHGQGNQGGQQPRDRRQDDDIARRAGQEGPLDIDGEDRDRPDGEMRDPSSQQQRDRTQQRQGQTVGAGQRERGPDDKSVIDEAD